jgi:hypothetical protein
MLKTPMIEGDCQRSRVNINHLGGFAKYSVQLEAEPSRRMYNSILSCAAAQRQRASLGRSTRSPRVRVAEDVNCLTAIDGGLPMPYSVLILKRIC